MANLKLCAKTESRPRRSRSLSAVSEAPTSRELGVEALWRALQIQRLEGSRPWGLWDLYLDERVLMVCEFAVAIGRSGFTSGLQREGSWGGEWESLNRTTIVRSDKCETQNQCARRSRSEIRGWGCGFMQCPG
jgi:hypothetical protein